MKVYLQKWVEICVAAFNAALHITHCYVYTYIHKRCVTYWRATPTQPWFPLYTLYWLAWHCYCVNFLATRPCHFRRFHLLVRFVQKQLYLVDLSPQSWQHVLIIIRWGGCYTKSVWSTLAHSGPQITSFKCHCLYINAILSLVYRRVPVKRWEHSRNSLLTCLIVYSLPHHWLLDCTLLIYCHEILGEPFALNICQHNKWRLFLILWRDRLRWILKTSTSLWMSWRRTVQCSTSVTSWGPHVVSVIVCVWVHQLTSGVLV